MKKIIIAIIILFVIIEVYIFASRKRSENQESLKRYEQSLKQSRSEVLNKEHIVTIDNLASARLLDYPDYGKVITRIPSGTKLKVLDYKTVTRGQTRVTWFKVIFQGNEGWISEYVTIK